MPTPLEIRNIRLRNDHEQMVNLRSQGQMITWTALSGTEPYVEAYAVTVRVRSFINGGAATRDEHVVRVELPADYPSSSPRVVMISPPLVFHPNWWDHGLWCAGSTWTPAESLATHLLRMVKTLQYDAAITNTRSPANRDANSWYMQTLRSNPAMFPCDRQPLPDPTKRKGFEVVARKTFDIRGS